MNRSNGGQPNEEGKNPHGDWLRELRHRGAIDERRRQRWLEQQLQDQATMLGLLVDLADSGTAIVLETTSGQRHNGTVAVVGIDVVVITNRNRTGTNRHRTATDLTNTGRPTIVALSAIAAIRSTGTRRLTSGADGEHNIDVTLLELLADRLDDRPEVSVSWTGGQQASGRLVAVGHDAVTLHTDGVDSKSVHIAALAIVDVTIV